MPDQLVSNQNFSDETQGRNKPSDTESIVQFFSGCNVLVTGGLGFLGKLLIEKLLRFCPNVATLYVLVRRKDGKSPVERVKQLAEMPLYKELKKKQPDFLQKLTVIEGNLDMEHLGLSPENQEKLLDTHVIFHGTSIIRSNQKLRTMGNVHVQSTKQILQLAKTMKDLKAFVHLSTVFAHSELQSIEEKHYPPPMKTDAFLTILEAMNDKDLEAITPKLIGSWPSTFAYTKAIAEETVLQYGITNKIPACIVRPSVVTPTWQEPIVGWADSMYGPVGLLVGSSLGLLRTIHCNIDKKLDFVPADYVTSCLIAAAWRTNVRNGTKDFKTDVNTGIVPDAERIPVYNFVSSCQKPITWRTFQEHMREHRSTNIRLKHMFWNNTLWMHKTLLYLCHFLPATVVDTAGVLTGRNSGWCKAYNLINDHLRSTSYFTTQQWHFENNATVKLWEQMCAVDRKLFEFDMSNFDWDEYMKRMIEGIHAFVDKTWNDVVEEGLAEYVEL